MTIAVDFDGVIIPDGYWPNVAEPNIQIIRHLVNLQNQGHKLILWTSRVDDSLKQAVDLCQNHGLVFDAVNDNLPEIIEHFGINSRKIYAHVYIDNRAICLDHDSGSLQIDKIFADIQNH